VDDFELDRMELTASVISMEFGQGGRIQQMWVAESPAPEATQEFQFVCPPLDMGEEVTEDYFPGTILLGARTSPDDPWIVSRNATAVQTAGDEFGQNSIGFEYEFSFLDELGASGRFYEISGPVPQLAWDVEITNRSRRSVEIGELAFPLALNNVYEGFPRTDEGTRDLFHDRLYVHKFIGGAASYIFAERMNGRPPGLLIYPGDDTRWEFYNHVPASLNTPYRWEGIPVVYVHSRAAIEREGWPEWFGGHTSLVLEPGDVRTYKMRFAGSDRFDTDAATAILASVGRPVIGLAPSAVAPADVGIFVEIAGATPARFFTDVDAELETDAGEDGGSCLIKPVGPGSLKLSFEDTAGRESEVSLLFTSPIESLIQRRAEWIVDKQIVKDEPVLRHAIVAGNTLEGVPITDVESFLTPFGIESGLADALFLAEKNTLYPVKREIVALDEYLQHFLEQKVVNPGDGSIGSLLPNPFGVAVHAGRESLYPLAYCLYDAMARIADGYGETKRPGATYLRRRGAILRALARNAQIQEYNGIPMASYLLEEDGEEENEWRTLREAQMSSRKYPFNADSMWSTGGFEEAFWAAKERGDAEGVERYLRYANAARSLSPCWWWYGSDKRWSDAPYAPPNPGLEDKGEVCLGPTTVANSLLYLSMMDRDSHALHGARLRLAYGGLMGIWALVREDGAASMGFCPDAASKQFGMSWTTGDIGVGLFHYLRGAASYVLTSRTHGLQTYGCHFEAHENGAKERFVIRPWDGVGRRIVVRHVGLDVTCDQGRIREFSFDAKKRNATLTLQNTSDKVLRARLEIRGLWGERFDVEGEAVQAQDGALSSVVELPAQTSRKVDIKVIG